MTNAIPMDVIIGVDTHKDVHAAAAISGAGVHLATTTIPASSKGYGALEAWAKSMGAIQAFGIEGTGSYGAGLSRFLRERGHTVVEVNRPNRQLRGISMAKATPWMPESAARAVLAGQAAGQPKSGTGNGRDDPSPQDRSRHRGQGEDAGHADAQGNNRLLSGRPARAASTRSAAR